jgi:hypothetical protein
MMSRLGFPSNEPSLAREQVESTPLCKEKKSFFRDRLKNLVRRGPFDKPIDLLRALSPSTMLGTLSLPNGLVETDQGEGGCSALDIQVRL